MLVAAIAERGYPLATALRSSESRALVPDRRRHLLVVVGPPEAPRFPSARWTSFVT